MDFTHYTYTGNTTLPTIEGQYETSDYDALVKAAGEDPNDEEISLTLLSEPWEGHPAGALVVTGLSLEGHPFHVSAQRMPNAGYYRV